MADIDATRNYQDMIEDMIGEALFPTLSTYSVFTDSVFGASQRLKGSLDFDLYTSDSGFPLILWKYMGIEGPEDFSTTSYSIRTKCRVGIAHRGPRDIDGTANTAGHQECWRDLYLIRQCMRKQIKDSRLTAGPFGINNTGVVTGQGSSPLSCVYDVTFGEDTVEQSLSDSDEDNLGPNTWIGYVDVFIHMIES